MGTFWQDVKQSVKKGVSTAADKTEEYGKIGKIKLDIMNVEKQLDKAFRELGEKTHEGLKVKTKANLSEDGKIKGMVEKIDALKKNISDKKAEIETIKKEAESKKDKKEEKKEKKTKPDTDAPKSK
ncbi:MAG TPA: hypothetical protein ENN17_12140 [bacterium]|nr:hypothetical protein [bacterium]